MEYIREPLYYAAHACDTMMRKYKACDLPPKGRFHYHQGVFLSGMYKIYCINKEESYFDYIKAWVDSVIDKDGNVLDYDPGQLDDIQPAVLLYPLLDRTKDSRYQKALDTLLPLVLHFPRNPEGGFWHKSCYPNQMWLDGLYMAGPISAEYALRYHKPEYRELAVRQAVLMAEKTRDGNTGLWYHAWDYSREADWCDKDTGLSPEFWGRSIGWVPTALLDELDFIPEGDPGRETLQELTADLLKAVCRYQSEEGRWYQVVDKGGQEGNWLENSCSCLFVGALCKAVRLGILGEEYLAPARKGYEAVIRSLTFDGKDLLIGDVCVGTGVGNYRHYCERPVSVNDLHGVGAFLLMCAQAQRII